MIILVISYQGMHTCLLVYIYVYLYSSSRNLCKSCMWILTNIYCKAFYVLDTTLHTVMLKITAVLGKTHISTRITLHTEI